MRVESVTALVIFFSIYYSFCAPDKNFVRIVGGKLVNISKIPYQLSLQFEGEHKCGASIISRRWAVTAAHCVVRDWDEGEIVEAVTLSLRAGSNRNDEGGALHGVARVIPHQMYDQDVYDYDIALLKVKPPFVIGPNVRAIRLPSRNYLAATGAKAKVSGWGHRQVVQASAAFMSQNKELARSKARKQTGNLLRRANVTIVSRGVCHEVYPELTSRMLCAGRYPTGGTDSCQVGKRALQHSYRLTS
ncbi:trypsin-2-like isoform X2 [Zootermopsis nevadensis]|uniref:trypsin-2-like isoform X2 n=1 Tax=Zootermopsis nevadensis TaxID=136037 RepID=UPI000B8E66FD|nr:trypsin-2-like isoform X2 [Zootermopsis nevadensis]